MVKDPIPDNPRYRADMVAAFVKEFYEIPAEVQGEGKDLRIVATCPCGMAMVLTVPKFLETGYETCNRVDHELRGHIKGERGSKRPCEEKEPPLILLTEQITEEEARRRYGT